MSHFGGGVVGDITHTFAEFVAKFCMIVAHWWGSEAREWLRWMLQNGHSMSHFCGVVGGITHAFAEFVAKFWMIDSGSLLFASFKMGIQWAILLVVLPGITHAFAEFVAKFWTIMAHYSSLASKWASNEPFWWWCWWYYPCFCWVRSQILGGSGSLLFASFKMGIKRAIVVEFPKCGIVLMCIFIVVYLSCLSTITITKTSVH